MTNLSECADQLEEVVASLRQFGEGDGFWRRVAHQRNETIGRLTETAVVFHGRHMDSKARLEHEQEANARLLKTIDEVCSERDEALGKLDEVQQRLSDLMGYITDEEQPEPEPEPGQCWHTINKDYDFIYRWNEDASSILIWRPWKGAWEDSSYKSFTNIENAYGDLEPVENPESNA